MTEATQEDAFARVGRAVEEISELDGIDVKATSAEVTIEPEAGEWTEATIPIIVNEDVTDE